jgi:hypothetical protein
MEDLRKIGSVSTIEPLFKQLQSEFLKVATALNNLAEQRQNKSAA